MKIGQTGQLLILGQGDTEGLTEAVATADFVKNASKLLNVHEEQTLLQLSALSPPINLPQKFTAQGSVEEKAKQGSLHILITTETPNIITHVFPLLICNKSYFCSKSSYI